MSRILNNCSPFSPELLQHTEPQLDFILEMYSKDHPDEYEFVRPSKPKPLPSAEILAEWERRLLKQAQEAFWANLLPSQAVLQRASQIAGAGALLNKAAAVKG